MKIQKKKQFILKIGFFLLILALGFNLSLNNINLTSGTSIPDYWPSLGWQFSTPAAQGMNSQKLEEMNEYLRTFDYSYFVDSLLVIKNGYLVSEYYAHLYNENTTHYLFSVTKSFTSTLIGLALEKGYLSNLNQTMLSFFENVTIQNRDSLKEAITIEHLLTMTCGLPWNDVSDAPIILGHSNAVQYVLDLPMAAVPGTEWWYNSGASHILSAIVQKVTPNGTLAFAQDELFTPLGIKNFQWEKDRQGIPFGLAQLALTPRDMAKFGFLFLHQGKWDGQQILTSEWVSSATRAHVIFGDNNGIYGYGYQWWIMQKDISYAARGLLCQNIYVYPDDDLIVVNTGSGGYPIDNIIQTYILSAIDRTAPFLWIFPVTLFGFIALIGIGAFVAWHSHKKSKIIS